MRAAFLWAITTQRVVVITVILKETQQSQLQWSGIQEGILALEYGAIG